MAQKNDSRALAEFDDWLRSCPPIPAPPDLRQRCRDTIPMHSRVRRSSFARWMVETMRTRRVIAALSTVAAGLLLVWWLTRPPRSAFAEFDQTLANTRAAEAVHWMSRYVDMERRPNDVNEEEWWFVRGVGRSQVAKRNGELVFRACWSANGTMSAWNAEKNEVVIEPSVWRDEFFEWITNPQSYEQCVEYESKAKKQNVPIHVDRLVRNGKDIRRIHFSRLRIAEIETAAQLMSAEIEIDVSGNRTVRLWTRYEAVGQGREKYFANLDYTSEIVFEYPDARAVDPSVFELEYPADATVMRFDAPRKVRDDVPKLNAIAKAVEQFRADHGDRLPTRWVEDLLPYLEGPNATAKMVYFYTSDDLLPKAVGWRFHHTGERYSEITDPENTVIAEHTYEGGFRMLLYASGRTEICP